MRFASPQSPGVSPLNMLLRPRWPAEGHMNKVDSSSLASFTSPLYRLTTPAAREEQGTSLYLRYNIPPHAPRAGSAKEATSGVFAGPAWPDFASPAVASLEAIPPRPPVGCGGQGRGGGRGARRKRKQFGFKRSRMRRGCNKPGCCQACTREYHLFGHSILPFSQLMMIPSSVNMY